MKKFKIFITCMVLYEFVMIVLLQVRDYCNGLFNYNFCATEHFKYILLCVMLPVLIMLFLWWWSDIMRIFNPECPQEQEKTFTDVLFEMIPKVYIKRFIIAAVIVALRKIVSRYPKTKNAVVDVFNLAKNMGKTK